MTHTTFSTMTDTEIRTANENARELRKEAINELIDLDQYLIDTTDTETVALIDLDQYLID